MGIPGQLNCLLKNLYAGQETSPVRTGHGTIDWFKIGKGGWQDCILSPAYLAYAEYTMRNARLDESEARSKIVWRNVNSINYADGTTLLAESEEEQESLLMKVKEESEKKIGLKLNIQKTKIMASSSITSL